MGNEKEDEVVVGGSSAKMQVVVSQFQSDVYSVGSFLFAQVSIMFKEGYDIAGSTCVLTLMG